MDDAELVGVVEPLGHLEGDQQALRWRQAGRRPVEDLQQASPEEDLCHQVGGRGLTPVVDRQQVGVAQGGRRLGLSPETAKEPALLTQTRSKALDRYPATEEQVLGQVDPG